MKHLTADLHYRCSVAEDDAVNTYAGLRAALNQAENKHLLPTSSLEYNHLDFTLEGGTSLGRFVIDAEAGYHLSTKADLALADATTDYATQVLLPDMTYYDANYWRGHLQVTYQFPITLKGTRSTWFVRAYGDYLKTNNSLDASTIGLSIGLYN